MKKIDPPFRPHDTYISVSDNLLCLQYSRNGHLKSDGEPLKRTVRKQYLPSLASSSVKKNSSKGSSSKSSNGHRKLPSSTKKHLIIPLSSFWELILKCIATTNK